MTSGISSLHTACTPIKKTSESELCTLRLSAPAVFRACVPRQGNKDTPPVVVGEWAKLLETRTSPLTGGHWQSTQDQTGPVLVGYLRVPKELAEKAVHLSGSRALFATIIAKGSAREPIRWIDRDRNVSDENYYRLCLSQAETQGKPLIFRNGGGRSLGILGAHDAHDSPRLRTAPKSWDQADLTSFLRENSWKQPAAVLTRRRSWSKGSPPEWLFRAYAPVGAQDDVHFAYADEASYITIVPETPALRPSLSPLRSRASERLSPLQYPHRLGS